MTAAAAPGFEEELLSLAEEAARAAAEVLRARFGHAQHDIHTKSSPTDLVSDADVTAEAAVREVILARRPGDSMLAEEGGATDGDSSASAAGAVRWIVDPLDGTVNFLFGIPVFAVSVACEDASGTVVGVVLDPLRNECFSAGRSRPAMLNGTVIHASERGDLATAMVATGFAYDAAIRARQAAVLARVLPRVRDIRRAGAAALDLSWSAYGRYDAYYERGLHAWDLAAGALIAQRAGLSVRPLEASAEDPSGVVVAPPALVDELFGLVSGGT
jgi:myo-inositol-1(or 4)-monophosphatase